MNETIDREQVLAKAEAAVKRAPENGALRRLLGRALLDMGRAEEAVEAYKKALELGFREEDCYSELSIALRFTGDYFGANRILEDGWAQNPKSLTLPLLLYSAKLNRTDYDGAVAVIDRAIAVHPANYKLRHVRIVALLRGKMTAKAAEYAEEIKEQFAGEREFIYDRADLMLRLERPQEALELLTAEHDHINPEGKMYLTLLARCHTALRDAEKAEEAFRKLYSLYPEKQTALSLATLCMQRSDFDAAREYLGHIIALQDRSAEYFAARLMFASCRMAEDPEAGKALLQALIDEIDSTVQENPRNFIPMVYAAESYRMLGNPAKAAECDEYAERMRRELEAHIDSL